jgi:enhancer of mRNA-decapping protein 3
MKGNEANFNNRRKNQHKYRNTNESNGHSDTNNNYMFHHNQHHNHHHNQNNDNNHFETGSVNSLEDEFDFEKNLALFDKNAFYEEMGVIRSNDETAALAAVTTSASCGNFKAAVAAAAGSVSSSNEISPKTSSSFHNIANNFTSNKNYRFDEMILDTGEPINFQQIQVPTSKHSANKRYVTDEGFVIPCIDLELRRKLFEEAQKNGLCKQRQVECMGKCCTEMALQLVGGSIRFSVKNSHQKPSFLVLVNCNSIQGVYALCTARLLANKSAKIFVLLYNANLKTSVLSDFMNEMGEITFEDRNLFINELNLFCSVDSSNYKILKSLDELRELKSIDLIISGLEMQIQTQNSTLVFRNLTRFIENSKASVLTIDPTVEDNSSSSSSMCSIPSKWSITPVLPLAFPESCGRVYLCDFGFTKKMFQSVNIKYESPFGSKFLIPLHND